MKTINALARQCLADIAIEHCGSFEAVIHIARANNLSITAALTDGQLIHIPEQAPQQPKIADRLRLQGIHPACDFDRPLRDVFSPEFSPEFT